MSDGSRPTLDEWLRAAYASEEAGCPPPESFLEAEAARLSPAERQALEAHADRCPACAAERDLARLFDAAPGAADVRPADLDAVVARLAEASPARAARPAAGRENVTPFPGPRRAPARAALPRSRALFRLAAAAALVLGVGLGYRALQDQEPALPPPPQQVNGATRGGEVEAVAPVGEVAEMPAELRWVVVKGASSYRVRIRAVDGAVLWESTVPAPPVPLPAPVAGRLHRAVLYTWTVEALDPDGARLASSGPVRFRVPPGGE